MNEQDRMPVIGRDESKSDRRKAYPSGTRASFELDAQTDEPQTKARGRAFQETMRDVALEACALAERRLAERGYTVRVRIVDANCEAWFPAEVVEWRDAR